MLIETLSKKKAKSEWKESLDRGEILQLETIEDFTEAACRKHCSIVGVSTCDSQSYLALPQDGESFSKFKEASYLSTVV